MSRLYLNMTDKVAACMGNMGRAFDSSYADFTGLPSNIVFPSERDLP